MPEYDITFSSVGTHFPKPITCFVVAPKEIDERTGAMLFLHGWGGNRFQYQAMMRDFVPRYNLVGIAPEYRQSGYDADPVAGRGTVIPYDFSHFQVLDALGSLLAVLRATPGVNKRRLHVFGGSQGGHIAALATIFAPNTFALTICACALFTPTGDRFEKSGRLPTPDDHAVRDAVRFAHTIRNKVVLCHGTADELVSHEQTRSFERALQQAGVPTVARYIEGGTHGLAPITTRQAVVEELAHDDLLSAETDRNTDFDRGTRVVLSCVERSFVLDWGRPFPDVWAWEPRHSPGEASPR